MNTEKEKKAIKYLKTFEPKEEPYFLCYSGGKDSDTIKILAKLAGVNFEAVHNLTTVDAPETVQYVKSQKDVKISRPERTMWELIVDKQIPPTRLIRYCCAELKERSGKWRVKVTGVRWAESSKRKENGGLVKIIGKPKTMQKMAEERDLDYRVTKSSGLVLNDDNDESRRFVEQCYRTTSTMINPIIDWTDDDVWEFLKHYGCKSNPLYECEYKRIGCIGCPMAPYHQRTDQFLRYPKYRQNYVRAFDRMLKERKSYGKKIDKWSDGESVMRWWLGENPMQINMDDYLELAGRWMTL
jgi:phosphoadenosine phosphosulfate reductase